MENKKKLRIVFFGEDSFSNIVLLSLIERHEVLGVVTPLYDNNVYKKLSYTANSYEIPLLRVKNVNGNEVQSFLEEVKPDLCVVAHFEKLIKPNLLSIPKMGFINVHPSLLPDYRGMAPQHWPIINGDSYSGVTVHKIDNDIDTGDIIVQESFEINSNDYVTDVQKKWMRIYKYIVVDAIDKLLANGSNKVQSNLDGRYYGKLSIDQCKLNMSGSINEAYNLIRGVSFPYFGARIDQYAIDKAHIADDQESKRYSTQELSISEQVQNKFLKFKDGILIIDRFRKS